MHELSITQSLLDITLEQVRLHGASKVSRIHVVAGAMHNLVDDSLRFCFEVVSKGTPAEGAELSVQTVPARAQ
ncbi:MAG: hydrogenase maturation nickel metallochaperone HypA, partial [Deltaproteobacteria bacterium]|nr:hydrogenase maturation nickel metallochaperone HypA [Deltaproteobacteria bacterium]